MTKQIIAIGLVLLLGYIGYESYQIYSAVKVPVDNLVQNNVPATSTDMGKNVVSNEQFDTNRQFTLADIATHNNTASCYTTVRGVVYDLTNFISKHPGGATNILKICGKDGTSAFERKHGGRPGPEEELKGHEIGVLVQ